MNSTRLTAQSVELSSLSHHRHRSAEEFGESPPLSGCPRSGDRSANFCSIARNLVKR